MADHNTAKTFESLVTDEASKQEIQISELQENLAKCQDARREDRFVFIVCIVLLLDVVFFSIMPSFGGPLALLIIQLLILIPLAKRMGMEEIAQILSRVLHRMAGKGDRGE
jgi:TRAP-type C4-dicarboxylate transport system permease large subunit